MTNTLYVRYKNHAFNVGAHSVTLYWQNDSRATTVDVEKKPPSTAVRVGGYAGVGYVTGTFGNLIAGQWYTFWINNWDDGTRFGNCPVSLQFPSSSNHSAVQKRLSANADTEPDPSEEEPAEEGLVEVRAAKETLHPAVFDILVPPSPAQTGGIVHYVWEDGGGQEPALQLQDVLRFAEGEALLKGGALALLQSWQDLNVFVALAPVTLAAGDTTLRVWQFTPGGSQTSATVAVDGRPIASVTGSPALIQNPLNELHVLVPQPEGLFHYTHSSQTIDESWKPLQRLPLSNRTPAQSVALAQTDDADGMVAVALTAPTEQGSLFALAHHNESWSDPLPVVVNEKPVEGVLATPSLLTSNDAEGKKRLELLIPTKEGILHVVGPEDESVTLPHNWQYVDSLPPLPKTVEGTLEEVSFVQTEPSKLQAFVRLSGQDGEPLLFTYAYEREKGWSEPTVLPVLDKGTTGQGDADDSVVLLIVEEEAAVIGDEVVVVEEEVVVVVEQAEDKRIDA